MTHHAVAAARFDQPRQTAASATQQPNEWKRVQRGELAAPTIIDWDYYVDVASVPRSRIEIARTLADRVNAEIPQRGLSWRRQFNRNWVSYKRAGGYNVFRIGTAALAPQRRAQNQRPRTIM